MKNILLGLALASAGVGVTLPAHAAKSADLIIQGRITPPACDLTFTDATVDFGTRTFGSLNIGGTILPTQTTTLNISCSGATRVSFSAADNRSESAIAADDVTAWPNLSMLADAKTIWGLGTTGTADAKIGGMEVVIDPNGGRIDDAPISANLRVISGMLGQATWNGSFYASTANLSPRLHYSFGPYQGPPQAVSNVSLPLKLAPVIARPANLPADDEINLDGSLTFTLHYL
jgi:hypothetical protein